MVYNIVRPNQFRKGSCMQTTAITYQQWRTPSRNIVEFNTLKKEYEYLRRELKEFTSAYLFNKSPIHWEHALTKLNSMFETLYSRPELQQVPGAKHIREEQVIYGQLFNQQLLNIHDELKQRYSTELNLVYNDIKHHRVKQARQKLAQLKGWPTKQPKMNILWFQIHYSECNMKLSKLERSLQKARYTIYSRWFKSL